MFFLTGILPSNGKEKSIAFLLFRFLAAFS